VLGDRHPLFEDAPEPDVELLLSVEIPLGSNAVVEFCVSPVVGVDLAFFAVSDCNASSADEAAPRAANMQKLLDLPHPRGLNSLAIVQQAVCQRKNAVKTTTLAADLAAISRQMMPQRQNLPASARHEQPSRGATGG
jgi:hypothetical protein